MNRRQKLRAQIDDLEQELTRLKQALYKEKADHKHRVMLRKYGPTYPPLELQKCQVVPLPERFRPIADSDGILRVPQQPDVPWDATE